MKAAIKDGPLFRPSIRPPIYPAIRILKAHILVRLLIGVLAFIRPYGISVVRLFVRLSINF